MPYHCLLTSIVSDEESAVNHIGVHSIVMNHLLLCLFVCFFTAFKVSILTVMCFDVDLFVFILSGVCYPFGVY